MTTVHYPNLFVQQIKHDPDAGRKIFKEFCAACHAKNPIIQVHAPPIGDPSWAAKHRYTPSRLLQKTLKGEGAMPARGGCFECSEAQLKQAIDYIVNQSK